MMSFFSKIVAIIESIVLTLVPAAVSPTPSPEAVLEPAPVVVEVSVAPQVGVVSTSTTSATPKASPSPALTPSATPIPAEKLIEEIQELKRQIALYTPEPTPTPQVIVVIQTPTPTPTPIQKANVVLNGNSVHRFVKPNDWVIGFNSEQNFKLRDEAGSLSYPIAELPYYLVPSPNNKIEEVVWESSVLHILINVNNHTNENPSFSCYKFGNPFWSGETEPKDHWEDNVFKNRMGELMEFMNGKTEETLKFGVTCNNSDGSMSTDYILVKIIKS